MSRSSGSIMLSSSGYSPVTVWVKITSGRRMPPSRKNLLAGMILPRALPVKSGNRHSTSVMRLLSIQPLILSMLNPDFTVAIGKGV